MEEGNESGAPAFIPTSLVQEQPVQLGKSGVTISAPLGIGCWSWGDTRTWGYQGFDPSYAEETIEQAFLKSIEKGVNFFDTAEVYASGGSEKFLGSFLARYQQKQGTAAQPVVVATKFLPFPWRFTHGSFFSALNGSLKRLQMKSVDLYQVHGPAPSVRSVEVWAECMAEAHKQGLIRSVGVSNYSVNQLRRTHAVLAKHGIALASNQIEFSL